LSIRADDALPADASLARIVGRLANQDACSPRDWAEMARETVDWGQHLQSESQTVPTGPVGDALAAVDAGSRLDPALTDWQRLRAELDALRIKPEEKKSEPPPPPQPKPQSRQKQSGGLSQRVGGAAQRQPAEAPTRDSSLVVPLEELDQVRNQDDPGELLRMMENNEPHPATTGKDW
jgi:Ca-activated chloride channel family protein